MLLRGSTSAISRNEPGCECDVSLSTVGPHGLPTFWFHIPKRCAVSDTSSRPHNDVVKHSSPYSTHFFPTTHFQSGGAARFGCAAVCPSRGKEGTNRCKRVVSSGLEESPMRLGPFWLLRGRAHKSGTSRARACAHVKRQAPKAWVALRAMPRT